MRHYSSERQSYQPENEDLAMLAATVVASNQLFQRLYGSGQASFQPANKLTEQSSSATKRSGAEAAGVPVSEPLKWCSACEIEYPGSKTWCVDCARKLVLRATSK